MSVGGWSWFVGVYGVFGGGMGVLVSWESVVGVVVGWESVGVSSVLLVSSWWFGVVVRSSGLMGSMYNYLGDVGVMVLLVGLCGCWLYVGQFRYGGSD